jgi:Ca2+-binding EF-hand superfamily protein
VVNVINMCCITLESNARCQTNVSDNEATIFNTRWSHIGEACCALFLVFETCLGLSIVCYYRYLDHALLGFDVPHGLLKAHLFKLLPILTCPLYFFFDVFPNITFINITFLFMNLKLSRTKWLENFFSRVDVMLAVTIRSFPHLIMVLGVLFFIIYMFAVALSYWVSKEADRESQTDELKNYFGNLFKVMNTLLMAVSGGDDWGNIANSLKELGSGGDAPRVVFAFYVVFMSFGFLNVVTGMFCDQAMQLASRSREARVREKKQGEEALTKELESIFREGDDDGNGTLTWDEFKALLREERVSDYLQTLELDFSELRTLFEMLDTDKIGNVSIEEFVWGCVRLQGNAKSLDLCTLLYEHRQFKRFTQESFMKIEHSLQSLMAPLFLSGDRTVDDPSTVDYYSLIPDDSQPDPFKLHVDGRAALLQPPAVHVLSTISDRSVEATETDNPFRIPLSPMSEPKK